MLTRDGTVRLLAAVVVLLVVYHKFGGLRPPGDVDYGLIFDAGSTGSRLHVFEFETGSGRLVKEILQEVKPGLQAFAHPDQAAASLAPLMATAAHHVPPHRRPSTPLSFKATAGLRRLGPARADALLAAVRTFLKTHDFPVVDDAVSIISGAEEGVYAWLTVNHLLGRLEEPPAASTVGIMDLGGGSAQIVFQPNGPSLDRAPAINTATVAINGHTYRLYLHSHEGFGLNDVRQQILQALAPRNPKGPIPHPCIPVGHEERLRIQNKDHVFVASKDTGYAACAALARALLAKGKSCKVRPCSFGGVFQPNISDPSVFHDDLYAYSYFYDRTQFLDGRRYPELTVEDYRQRAAAACNTPAGDRDHGVLCLDLTYMHVLLREGYDLLATQPLKIYKKIDGIETAWPLGAVVAAMRNATVSFGT